MLPSLARLLVISTGVSAVTAFRAWGLPSTTRAASEGSPSPLAATTIYGSRSPTPSPQKSSSSSTLKEAPTSPTESLLRGRWLITSTNDITLLQDDQACSWMVDIDSSGFRTTSRCDLLSGTLIARKSRLGSFRVTDVEDEALNAQGHLWGLSNLTLSVKGELCFEADLFEVDSIVGLPAPPALGSRVVRDLEQKRRAVHVVVRDRDSLFLRLESLNTFYELTRTAPGAARDAQPPAASPMPVVLATHLATYLLSSLMDGLVSL